MQEAILNEAREGLSKLGYTLESMLSNNEDSNSEVWLATYKEAEKTEQRALKFSSIVVFNPTKIRTGNELKKLDQLAERESELLPKLNHPNIPSFKGFYQVPILQSAVNLNILATEYIPMKNLQSILEKGKKISDEQQLKILMADSLSALAYIHENPESPVLHRDIKPSNILFDEKKAYIFDFNLSQIGNRTTSFTIVDNNGYYPADTYMGQQTPSQDLCALGNVVIALNQGRPISLIRMLQGKDSLDAVDVSALPLSPNFKRFLAKLTAVRPAFRYQSASQALSDLNNIDRIPEEEMEAKVGTVMRSRALQLTLDQLKEQDPIFDYNIPPKLLTNYDDDSLIEHLKRTYSQDKVIISDPREIKRYIQYGDRVLAKKNIHEPSWTLDTGDTGIIKESKDSQSVKVAFDEARVTLSVNPENLEVIGRRKFIKRKMFPTPTLLTYMKDEERLEGLVVKYKGQKTYPKNEGYIVPADSEGLIASPEIINNKTLVIWANGPGINSSYKLGETMKSDGKYDHHLMPDKFLEMDSIKLVKINRINFGKIYEDNLKAARKDTSQ